jgi:SSS family solute:Na+ symporter
MKLHAVDITIIAIYLVAMIAIGVIMVRRASKNLDSYFLAENVLPWWILGVSNASAMFDVTGTMWLVYNLYVYGLKGAWLPWLWPTFNQMFLMIYLSVWIRRSNVLTGAEWITTRFGSGRGAELSRISIVIFALVSVIGFMGYSFQGMGKFSAVFLPWDVSPNTYAMILMGITTVYVLMGGMFSVVITDVTQFTILTISCVVITIIAMTKVPVEAIKAAVPAGWDNLFFGWHLNMDWSNLLPALNQRIADDGYSLFGIFFTAMVFKGILVSIAGPAPNYDMQRVLAARTPKEASLMSGIVSICLVPRWLMVTSITIIGIMFLSPQFKTMGTNIDFEMVLPYVINNFLPAGLVGFLLAGLLAAFMANFSATLNAGGAYVVNDLYKRYIRPGQPEKHYVRIGYFCSLVILVAGITIGFMISSINQITQWIVSGLFGGYTAANVLKWYWYRLNGYGYFCGMIVGIAAALIMPVAFPTLHPLWGFPFILIFSTLACILGSIYSEPEEDEILIRFYTQVRPWGFWQPVLEKVLKTNPKFQSNKNFKRDMVNLLIGVAWQFALVTVPIYFVLRHMAGLWISIIVLVVTSIVLKINWYDKLEKDDVVPLKA